jgi:hypothetical protein
MDDLANRPTAEALRNIENPCELCVSAVISAQQYKSETHKSKKQKGETA